MGCNCKKTAENASKYTDDEPIEVLTGIKKTAMIISKAIIAILIFLILIVVCPFIILYCMICLVIGKPLKFKLFLKKKEQSNGKRE